MNYITDAVTVGLGYLVYKGIMTELAQEAVTPLKRLKHGQESKLRPKERKSDRLRVGQVCL